VLFVGRSAEVGFGRKVLEAIRNAFAGRRDFQPMVQQILRYLFTDVGNREEG
jgi:hypothetical protein